MRQCERGASNPMKKSDKLAIEASETRQAINALLGKDELSDEERGELDSLTKRMGELEVETRAAITVEAAEEAEAETVDDGEGRELRELRGKAKLGEYLAAAAEMRAVGGAEAEYNQALNMGADRFPLELLAPAPETRATTDTDSAVAQQTWLDRLFADTAAARLGISMRSVAPGVASFPITTAGATAAQRGRGEATADAAWTIGVTEMKPSRNAVRATFSMEDAARLSGLESALQRDLGMALAEGIDRAIFVGDDGAAGTDSDIVGLSTFANLTETTLKQADKVKGAETLATFAGLVDGVHAGGFGDLRTVATVGAWRLWESTVINSAADNMTLAAFLRSAGLAWTSRGGIEEATTNNKFGAFVGRGRGLEGAGVAAVWSSGQLIRDPYSGAAKGEVALTLNYLWSFGLPRPASFARLKFVT